MNESPRQAALLAGQPRYFSPTPCRQGHVGERYAASGHCVACVSIRNRNWANAAACVKRPTIGGTLIFNYRLHPDDHAAALAYCQTLDIQRGRKPSKTQAMAPTTEFITPPAFDAEQARANAIRRAEIASDFKTAAELRAAIARGDAP